MASVTKDGKGWRIRFYDLNGNQKTFRPGKGVNKATAEKIGRHVDELIVQTASRGTLDRQTAAWLGEIGDRLHDKLAKAGLVEPRVNPDGEPEPAPSTGEKLLSGFLQDHMDHGRTAKGERAAPATVTKWKPTQDFLNELFPNRTLASISAEDAYQFRVWLDKRRIKQKTAGRLGQPMSENAKRRHIATCKMFFNAAKRRGLIDSNPFEAQVSGTMVNRTRDFYVTPEMAGTILDNCPDAQWRLMFALWRLAGLRKMEIFSLTWGDIQWSKGKFLVRSSKTAHHEGHDIRFVPLRDVRPYLEDVFQAALEEGQTSLPADGLVITRFSKRNSNLDKPFRAIVERAGLTPWPKLFQNLRSSCETQWLKEGERADLVANWIGHSVKIQRSNYVQYTDDDIERFNNKATSKSGLTGGLVGLRIDPNSSEVALQVALNSRKTSKNTGFINPTRT